MKVDHDQIVLYLLGELDDRQTAEVERLVAEDPAWAEALAREAQAELVMFDVAAAAAAEQPAVAAPSWWARVVAALRRPVMPVLLLASALAVFAVVRVPTAELPTWQLEVRSGEAVTRGADDGGATTYTQGSLMHLVLRPASRTEARPDVTVRLDGAAVALPVRWVDGGAVEIKAVMGRELAAPAAGEHRLEIEVGGQDFVHEFVWKAGG